MGNKFPCLQKEHRQGSAHRFTRHLFVAYTAPPSSAGKAKAQQMKKPVCKKRDHPWGCMEGLAGKPSEVQHEQCSQILRAGPVQGMEMADSHLFLIASFECGAFCFQDE